MCHEVAEACDARADATARWSSPHGWPFAAGSQTTHGTLSGTASILTGDEQRLRQVIANIVGNALVHAPPGTPIEIRTFDDDGEAVIEITDHGPGMSEVVAARAFERFYRADPARSRHRGGSGLGLAIVDATVTAHGGTTRLDTAPGRGTTVNVRFPASSRGEGPGANAV